MAKVRRMKTSTLFRFLVAPALLLCAILRKPIFQWIAVVTVGIWLAVMIVQAVGTLPRRVKRNRKPVQTICQELGPSREHKEDLKPEPAPGDDGSRLFVLRQVNYRITEQLKSAYPMVAWLWVKRPEAEQLCKGGLFRIRTSNTDPFNFAEVELSADGRLKITMLQAVSLKDAATIAAEEQDDLAQEELLERVDVRTWYNSKGEQVLCQMIDDLNTQGHKKLLIKENGQVVIEVSGKEQPVETIQDFPPRMVWDEFCQLLRDDEIKATIEKEGLLLAW